MSENQFKAANLPIMQAESHWILKDLLTVVTLLGVFYNMQEGRDSNPYIRSAILAIESRYDRLNTWLARASEAQLVATLWIVLKRICITGIVLMMVAAKIYPHPTHVFRYMAYGVGGSLSVFWVCNQYLANDRIFDWRPLRWAALAALLSLVASAFFQFYDTQVARAASTLLDHTPLPLLFGREHAYLPLIGGGVCALALGIIGLVCVVSHALPALVGRLALQVMLRSMKGLATFIAWLDPKRKFAWFMFLVCAVMQLISNHL